MQEIIPDQPLAAQSQSTQGPSGSCEDRSVGGSVRNMSVKAITACQEAVFEVAQVRLHTNPA